MESEELKYYEGLTVEKIPDVHICLYRMEVLVCWEVTPKLREGDKVFQKALNRHAAYHLIRGMLNAE